MAMQKLNIRSVAHIIFCLLLAITSLETRAEASNKNSNQKNQLEAKNKKKKKKNQKKAVADKSKTKSSQIKIAQSPLNAPLNPTSKPYILSAEEQKREVKNSAFLNEMMAQYGEAPHTYKKKHVTAKVSKKKIATPDHPQTKEFLPETDLFPPIK
jgi:hypothetical protein